MEAKVGKGHKRKNHRSKSQIKRYRLQSDSVISCQADSPYARVTTNQKLPLISGAHTLKSQTWVNCDIIHQFTKLVSASTASCVRMESNLFTVLTTEGYQNRVVNWMKTVRTSKMLHYFFPICYKNHWSLLYVNTVEQICIHFTSKREW